MTNQTESQVQQVALPLIEVVDMSEKGVDKKVEEPTKFIIGGATDEDTDDEEEEPTQVVPPDGGWGWMVVAASFMCNVVVDGIIFTSGMLFPMLRDVFGASNAEVAWISSLLGGFYLLVGPFVSSLANAFGFRSVCILGAILGASACGISYFANSIYYLYGSFGIMTGIGFGLIYVPAVIATGFYFEKRRAFATGIGVCGSGIGTFIFSPLITHLLGVLEDDWRYIFFVYGGSILSCAIFGLAFRPLTAATGKVVKLSDELEPESDGTPLMMRIKRARDKGLAQFPSALSLASLYSRSNSRACIDDMLHNGTPENKGPTGSLVAKALLERHSMPKPKIIPPTPPVDTTIDEEEDDEEGSEKRNGSPGPPNGTSGVRRMSERYKYKVARNSLAVPSSGRRRSSQNRYPRIESAPNIFAIGGAQRRRSSQMIVREEAARPFYRDDAFYSGSLARIPQYNSSESMSHYHASVTRLPASIFEIDTAVPAVPEVGCFTAACHVLKKIFDFSLLSSVTFIVLALTGFMALFSLFVPFSFLPSYAISVGVEPGEVGFLMSLIGIFNTLGRLIAGWISDHPKVDALLVNNLALIIGGGATAILPFIEDLSLLYCYSITFGLSVAAFASLRSILLVELLGLEKLTNSFGLLLLFQGIAGTFGAPVAGLFVDATQNYKISFIVFGGVFALSGILCIPLRRIKKWEEDRIDRKLREKKYGVKA